MYWQAMDGFAQHEKSHHTGVPRKSAKHHLILFLHIPENEVQ